MPTDGSVTNWIALLRSADSTAAQRLWNRYSAQLVELARRRIGDYPKRIADEEDVALSVFRNICCGVTAGRFGDIQNRDELWWLILAITKKKVIDHKRREAAMKRGAGRVYSECKLNSGSNVAINFSLDQLVGEDPTPESLAILDEQISRLMGLLRDRRLQRVAIGRIEGYTTSEIATEMSISPRSVERKLKLIRSTWARQLTLDQA